MKNFKIIIAATLLAGGFALHAVPFCPFTLINRTDGVIHANIGTQAATVSEWVSPLGYKTLQRGGSSCFFMGRRFNEYNKEREYLKPNELNPKYKKAHRLHIRYKGTNPDETPYQAHVFNIEPTAEEFYSVSQQDGQYYGPYSISDFLEPKTIDYSKVVAIGGVAVLADPGWVKLILFGKERGTDSDAAVILSTDSQDKKLKLKVGAEVQALKLQYRLP